MMRGAQKQLIVVRTSGSRFFDEAYFVLRREITPCKTDREEMLREANRIIEGTDDVPQKARRGGWFWFLAGGLLGGAIAVAVFLFL